jgi:hypothetical protein
LLLLAACGSGGSGGCAKLLTASNPPLGNQQEESGSTAIDGDLHDPPTQNAKIYLNVNFSGQVDAGDVLVDPETDEQGQFAGEIPDAHLEKPLIADNRQAVHRGSGQPLPDYFMAPPGSIVISPMTHAIYINALDPKILQGTLVFARYMPLTDNIYDPQSDSIFAYESKIKQFLEDLTRLILTYRDAEVLRQEAIKLIRQYDEQVHSLFEDTAPPTKPTNENEDNCSAR